MRMAMVKQKAGVGGGSNDDIDVQLSKTNALTTGESPDFLAMQQNVDLVGRIVEPSRTQ
jgi:hypothetical protein